MRVWFLLASASTALAACATADEAEEERTSAPDASVAPPTMDAAPSDAKPDAETEPAFPTCSKAGWCTTHLPDGDLMMRDVWPHPARAFAIAESKTLGVKVLEWKDGDVGWNYIDDNTQNDLGGKYAAAIWSPNDDTVYYAVAPSYIYRGTRLSPPATGWSWSRQALEDNSQVGEEAHAAHDHGLVDARTMDTALGVWGVDANHVYAWYSNTVYRWRSDAGGAPAWIAEYVAADPDVASEHLSFVSAAGSGADDVWFAGARTQLSSGRGFGDCVVLVRKTPEGFTRVADGVVGNGTRACAERSGVPYIGGPGGWLTDIQSTGPGAITGLKGLVTSSATRPMAIARISAEPLTVGVDNVPRFVAVGAPSGGYTSFWRSSSDVWLTGWGLVVRGERTVDAGDSMAYGISTLSLYGAPIAAPMNRVRGTSNTNLWVLGNGYAFHKTTP